MGSSAKEIYRNLLKAVRKNIGKEEQKSQFADYIKEEFRRNINSGTENLKLARNYTFYLNSVHHHKSIGPMRLKEYSGNQLRVLASGFLRLTSHDSW
ncbi:hypothetical protein ACS0TY_009294 [Phlomoides rotata]